MKLPLKIIFTFCMFAICSPFSCVFANNYYTNKNNNILYTSSIKTSPPLSGKITSFFGYRIHPITYNLDFHPAIDISSNINSNIHSILPGTVKETGQSDIYGKYIKISHQNNIESMYCHCNKILKKINQHVSKGQLIGKVGHTGLATGDHLHLEVKINNINIDPLLLINFYSEK